MGSLPAERIVVVQADPNIPRFDRQSACHRRGLRIEKVLYSKTNFDRGCIAPNQTQRGTPTQHPIEIELRGDISRVRAGRIYWNAIIQVSELKGSYRRGEIAAVGAVELHIESGGPISLRPFHTGIAAQTEGTVRVIDQVEARLLRVTPASKRRFPCRADIGVEGADGQHAQIVQAQVDALHQRVPDLEIAGIDRRDFSRCKTQCGVGRRQGSTRDPIEVKGLMVYEVLKVALSETRDLSGGLQGSVIDRQAKPWNGKRLDYGT